MTPLPVVTAYSISIIIYLHERFINILKDRTNLTDFISFSSSFSLMAYFILLIYWLSMLLIVLPGSRFMRRHKPEWQELNEFRKYLRSDEFREKQKAFEVEFFKEVMSKK